MSAFHREGAVNVTVTYSDGTWCGCTKFTYKNHDVEAILQHIVQDEEKQREFFGVVAKGLRVKNTDGSGDQKTIPSGMCNDNSIKLLLFYFVTGLCHKEIT